jgi:hypothetical protein
MKRSLIQAALLSTATVATIGMPAAHAASGADVAAGILIGGIAGAVIASQPRQQVVTREVVVTQPVGVSSSIPVTPVPVYTPPQPQQCYYPGPPAAYGPCPGGAAIPQGVPQSYQPVAPQVIYTQQPTVVYTEPVYVAPPPSVIYYGRSYYPHRYYHNHYHRPGVTVRF